MSKSSSLPSHPPFRYKRPADDLQATFGAQAGNPPIVRAENAKPGKKSTAAKKSPRAARGKSSKASKPTASRRAVSNKAKAKTKAKTKKPAAKR